MLDDRALNEERLGRANRARSASVSASFAESPRLLHERPACGRRRLSRGVEVDDTRYESEVERS